MFKVLRYHNASQSLSLENIPCYAGDLAKKAVCKNVLDAVFSTKIFGRSSHQVSRVSLHTHLPYTCSAYPQ